MLRNAWRKPARTMLTNSVCRKFSPRSSRSHTACSLQRSTAQRSHTLSAIIRANFSKLRLLSQFPMKHWQECFRICSRCGRMANRSTATRYFSVLVQRRKKNWRFFCSIPSTSPKSFILSPPKSKVSTMPSGIFRSSARPLQGSHYGYSCISPDFLRSCARLLKR